MSNENITPLPWEDIECEFFLAIKSESEWDEALSGDKEYILKACNAYPALTARVKELEEALEIERMRVAACGAVAMANTPEAAKKVRDMHPDYWSASVQDVANAVDREMELRAALNKEPTT